MSCSRDLSAANLRHYLAIFRQGLKAGGAKGRGSRRHVHFSKALPGEPGEAQSGMRRDVESTVHFDSKAALQDGFPV